MTLLCEDQVPRTHFFSGPSVRGFKTGRPFFLDHCGVENGEMMAIGHWLSLTTRDAGRPGRLVSIPLKHLTRIEENNS